jgi:hypothetical protein
LAKGHAIAALAGLGRSTQGTFRGTRAESVGVTRKQLLGLCSDGAIARVLPDTYRLTSVAPSPMQRLHAALLWAGDAAAGAGRSAAMAYELRGRVVARPEIVVPRAPGSAIFL